MPKVNGWYFTSVMPAARILSASASPSGNYSTLAGR